MIKSPSYPSASLGEAIAGVAKIEGVYRRSAADREQAAKLLGYSGLSGPASKALAALASYGLVEASGKGMMKVTPLAVRILYPKDDEERQAAIREAATTPPLYRDIWKQFPDHGVPPEGGVISYLNRAGFNPSAVPKAAKAFRATAAFVEELPVNESRRHDGASTSESEAPGVRFGGASVGDLIQWENQGTLQFETPRRVRWVSDDGAWVAVEGSDTGILMDQVIVETGAARRPPADLPSEKPADASPPKGQRKAVFPVSEGDVTFLFPEGLSPDGLQELEDYLEIFLKKERRRVADQKLS